MKIYIDADGCPVTRTAERIAKELGIPCVIVTDTSHEFESGYSRVVIASKGADSADFALLSMLRAGDIAITQDYGLAALCIAKGARAVNQNGMIYDNDNIDALLYSRAAAARIRRGGGRLHGPKKRTQQQDEEFSRVFRAMLTE